MKKFCTRCGRQFESVGREVICPSCKQAAAEEARHAAVLRAKKASWTGESVPVRISGRASTVIRSYGKANNLPFAAALDDLLKGTNYYKGVGQKWSTIVPYKSRRMKKSTDGEQDVPQAADKPQDAPQEAPQAPQTVQAAKTVKTVKTVKAASKAAGKEGKK